MAFVPGFNFLTFSPLLITSQNPLYIFNLVFLLISQTPFHDHLLVRTLEHNKQK